jgi:hypothetical protein
MRFTRLLTFVTGVALVAGVVSVVPVERADAATEPFDAGHLISDALMFDGASMSVAQIQSFLTSKVKKCSSTAEVPCLKSYKADILAKPATSLRCLTDIAPKKKQSAAQIISTVALACDVSPRVLIVTLQKEQGLVTSTSPTKSKYKIATGYGCPDGSACDAEFFGFFNQVYWAARAFQAYRNGSNFPAYQPGIRNIDYHPDEVRCGSKSVNVQNVATTALYTYTPYTPNAKALANPYKTGDSCSSYGNRNFWLYYNDWFGNTGAGDNLLTTATETALTIGTQRYRLPAASPRLLASFAPLDRPAKVSQAYANKFALSGTLSPIIRSSDLSVYLVANSTKYTITCPIAVELGFTCDGAVVIPAALLTTIPTSTALSGATTAWVETDEEQQYLLGDGERREILDPAFVGGATLGVKLAVDASVLAGIPYGVPFVPDSALVSVRGTKDFVTSTPTVSYRMPGSLVTQTKVATWFGKRPGALDEGSVAKLPGITEFPALFSDGGASYALASAGKTLLATPETFSADIAPLETELAAKIPTGSTLTGPTFVRNATSSAIYFVYAGERRRVSSTADATTIAKSRAVASTLRTLPDATVASVSLGDPLLPAGLVVRTSSKSPAWMIDGASSRVPVASSTIAEFTAKTKPRIVTAATLAGYAIAGDTLLPGVVCGEQSYLAYGGALHAVAPADADEYGPAYGFRSLDSATCRTLKKSSAIGVFLKYGTTYYRVADGARTTLTTSQYKAASAGLAPARTVSKYFLQLIPKAI